jgi:hypothetical protein
MQLQWTKFIYFPRLTDTAKVGNTVVHGSGCRCRVSYFRKPGKSTARDLMFVFGRERQYAITFSIGGGKKT